MKKYKTSTKVLNLFLSILMVLQFVNPMAVLASDETTETAGVESSSETQRLTEEEVEELKTSISSAKQSSTESTTAKTEENKEESSASIETSQKEEETTDTEAEKSQTSKTTNPTSSKEVEEDVKEPKMKLSKEIDEEVGLKEILNPEDFINFKALEQSYAPKAGNTAIETATIKWRTKDTTENYDDSLLLQEYTNNDLKAIQFEISAEFSGKDDYKPGDIQIKLPKYILQDREGRDIGKMELGIPENGTGATAELAYTNDVNKDYYIITNTQTLSAAAAVNVEGTIKSFLPSNIKDRATGYKTKPFSFEIFVNTAQNNLISKKSNEIRAEFDTFAQLSSVSKVSQAVRKVYPSSWPQELKPSNPDDYIYVDFYSFAHTKANQHFDIKAIDNARVNNGANKNAILLGIQNKSDVIKNPNNNGSMSLDFYSGFPFVHLDKPFYLTYYVAYPKKDFKIGETYKLENQVTYELTAKDDKTKSRLSDSAYVTYAPEFFKTELGYMHAHKNGDGDARVKDVYPTRIKYRGLYFNHLNKLAKGEDAKIYYKLDNVAFQMPYTLKGEPKPENYNQKNVKIEVEDNKVENIKEIDNYEFTKIHFDWFDVLDYKRAPKDGIWFHSEDDGIKLSFAPEGDYVYVSNNEVKRPVLKIYGTKDNKSKDYKLLANVNFDNRNEATIETFNGARALNKDLYFPEGIKAYKTEVNSKVSAFRFMITPYLKVKSTPEIQKQAKDLILNSDNGQINIDNHIGLYLTTEDKGRRLVDTDYGRNELYSAKYGLAPNKLVLVREDKQNRVLNLSYYLNVDTITNVKTKKSLDEALEHESVVPEDKGTFYDLLPEGVKVDIHELQSSDQILDAYIVRNFRDTNQDLLVVKVKHDANFRYNPNTETFYDQVSLYVPAYYNIDDLKDISKSLDNHMVYESSNPEVGNMKGFLGEKDTAYGNRNQNTETGVLDEYKDILTDINPDNDNASYVYARTNNLLTVDSYSLSELQKFVDTDNKGSFTTGLLYDERNVYENGPYSYQIKFTSSPKSQTKDMVFYDSIENYDVNSYDEGNADKGDVTFKGKFKNVDLSSLRRFKDLDPKVYYSTKTGLVLDDTNNRHDNNLNDTSIWSTVKPKDSSKVTAIAVDLSKNKDGSDFILEAEEELNFYINMQAPEIEKPNKEDYYDTTLKPGETEAGLTGGAHAYNNAVAIITTINEHSGYNADKLIRKDYTKVGLKPFDIDIEKQYDDDHNRDGFRDTEARIALYKNNEKIDSVVLNRKNNYRHTFKGNLLYNKDGSRNRYSLKEENINEYYHLMPKVRPKIDDKGIHVDLINKHEPIKIDIPVHKTFEGNENNIPKSISVSLLTNGKEIDSKKITPDIDGNWEYTFKDLYKYENGKEIDYSIKEEYIAGYKTVVNEFDITNIYYPYADLEISKDLSFKTKTNVEHDFEFTLSLYDSNGEIDTNIYDYVKSNGETGKISSGDTFTLKDNESIRIKKVASDQYYEIKETKEDAYLLDINKSDKLKGYLKADDNERVNIVNDYKAHGEYTIKAKKDLKGQDLSPYLFKFDVYHIDSEGNSHLVKTGSNDNNGNIIFNNFKFDETDAGKTYDYMITERVDRDLDYYTFDEKPEYFSLTIEDNGDGTLDIKDSLDQTDNDPNEIKFDNAYEASGSVELFLQKKMFNDLDFDAFDFEFELRDQDGKLISTAYNDANGRVDFEPIEYDATDIGKSYVYKATEVQGDNKDLIYDDSSITYFIHVKDAGKGKLTAEYRIYDNYTEDDDNAVTDPVLKNKFKEQKLRILKRMTDEDYDPNEVFTFEVSLEGEEVPEGTLPIERHKFTKPSMAAIANNNEINKENIAEVNKDTTKDIETKDTVASKAKENEEDSNIFAKALNNLKIKFNKPLAKTSRASISKTFNFSGITVNYYSDGTLEFIPLQKSKYGNGPIFNSTEFVQKMNDKNINKVNVTAIKFKPYKSYNRIYMDSSSDGFNFANYSNLKDISGLANFDVTHRTSLKGMFAYTPISDISPLRNWNVSNIKNMSAMFRSTNIANTQDLLNWNTNSLERTEYMFAQNKNLSDIRGLKNFKMGKVTQSFSMFLSTSVHDLIPLSRWDTSNIRGASDMFCGTNVTTLKGLDNWDTSNLRNTGGMFAGCKQLKDISALAKWNTSNVTDMRSMFERCYELEDISALSNWNTGKAEKFQSLFNSTAIRNVDALANWNVSNVGMMSQIFRDCKNLSDISGLANWNVGNVTSFQRSFENTAITNLDALSNWDVSKATNMHEMFDECFNLVNADGVKNWDVRNVTTTFYMFRSSALENLNAFSKWQTDSLTNIAFMFSQNAKLKDISGIANFDVSKVTNMQNLFHGADVRSTLPLKNWDVRNVENMQNMFNYNTNLSDLEGLRNWKTPSLTNMANIFNHDRNIKSIEPLRNWDVSNVTYLNNAFRGTGITNVYALENWDVRNVIRFDGIFKETVLDDVNGLSSWDVSKGENFNEAFKDATIKDISGIADWDTSNAEKMTDILDANELDEITLGQNFKMTPDMTSIPVNKNVNDGKDYLWISKDRTQGPYTAEEFVSKWKSYQNSPRTNPMAGKTFVAYVIPREYNVRYISQVDGLDIPSQTFDLNDEDFTIIDFNPNRLGYVFLGYDTNKYASTAYYKPGKSYQHIATETGETVTLYAIWEEMPNEINIKDGKFIVQMKANEMVDITLPAGIKYNIKEIDIPAGYELVDEIGNQGQVEVIDANDLELGTKNHATFVNAHKDKDKVNVALYGSKFIDNQLAGQEFDNQFSFRLTEPAGQNTLKGEHIGTNVNGKVVFSPITLNSPGTYTYYMQELDTNPKYDTDPDIKEVQVFVGRNSQGRLASSVTYVNAYYPNYGHRFFNYTKPQEEPDESIHLNIDKKVTGVKEPNAKFFIKLDLQTNNIGMQGFKEDKHVYQENPGYLNLTHAAANSVYIFPLKADENIRIDLPLYNSYTISEIDMPADYSLVNITNASKTFTGYEINTTVNATVTNESHITPPPVKPEYGKVTVEKQVDLPENNAQGFNNEFLEDFTFEMHIDSPEINDGDVISYTVLQTEADGYENTIVKKAIVKDKKIRFDLSNDSKAVIELPAGTNYRVEEIANNSNFRLKDVQGNKIDSISADVNKLIRFTNELKTKTISLHKAFTDYSPDAIKDADYPIKVFAKDSKGNYKDPLYVEDNGVYRRIENGSEFKINQTKTLSFVVPIDYDIEVVELDNPYTELKEIKLLSEKALDNGDIYREVELLNDAKELNLHTALELEAEKRLIKNGKEVELSNGQFEFLVLDKDNKIVASATNNALGTVVFDKIYFDIDDLNKDFNYRVLELRGSDANTVYDNNVYDVNINIEAIYNTDDGKYNEGAMLTGLKPNVNIELDGIKQNNMVFTNKVETRRGVLKIKKVNAFTGKALPGAIFSLYKDDNLIGYYESNEEGLAIISDLPCGDYTVKEIKAPEGYIINNEEFTASVNSEETGIIIENAKRPILPTTGSKRLILSAIGSSVLFAAFVILEIRRKKYYEEI